MEISGDKSKLMTNSANGIQKETKVKGQKLGTVKMWFGYVSMTSGLAKTILQGTGMEGWLTCDF